MIENDLINLLIIFFNGYIANTEFILLFQGGKFEVKAGSLAFSVMLYTICAILCICTLLDRRYLKHLIYN